MHSLTLPRPYFLYLKSWHFYIPTQWAFSIRHRNGVEISTSKKRWKRKNISTSKYRHRFDVDVDSTSKYLTNALQNVRIFRRRNIDVDVTSFRCRNILTFFNVFRCQNFVAISTSNRKYPLGKQIEVLQVYKMFAWKTCRPIHIYPDEEIK